MEERKYKKEWRNKRYLLGLCQNCDNNSSGKRLCHKCLEKQEIRRKKKLEARVINGLCPICGLNKPVGDKIICQICSDRDKKKKKNRRKNKLCSRCGESANKSYCEKCAKLNNEKAKERRLKNIEKGLCKCGKKLLNGKKWCYNCKNKKLEQNNFRKSKGICVSCGNNKQVAGNLCETCYYKAFSNRHFKNYKNWENLKKLYNNQNHKCPYTNIELTPGNMSLDHVIPISKNGTNNLDNLQWVYAPINTMKINLLEKEFLGIVKIIYKNRIE